MGSGFMDGAGQALIALAVPIAVAAVAIGFGLGWLVFA